MKHLKVLLPAFILLYSLQLPVFSATPDARKMKGIVEEGLAFSARQEMLLYESVKDIEGRLPNTLTECTQETG